MFTPGTSDSEAPDSSSDSIFRATESGASLSLVPGVIEFAQLLQR
ncbi:MAG: hypothetical protein JWM97_1284 [Phycisphaerales bacterium]|nr:hypothetical protein [Phycisphaerales bacterium]